MKGGILPIPREELRKFIGKNVHVRWANPACVWVLVWLPNEQDAIIHTRVSGRTLKVKQADLLKTRKGIL